MNTLAQVRKKVIVNGKLRYGAASRLSALLGIAHGDVVRMIVGNSRGRYLVPTTEQLAKLTVALASGVELYAVRASTIRCDEPGCKKPSKCKGKCSAHYFKAWRKAMQFI